GGGVGGGRGSARAGGRKSAASGVKRPWKAWGVAGWPAQAAAWAKSSRVGRGLARQLKTRAWAKTAPPSLLWRSRKPLSFAAASAPSSKTVCRAEATSVILDMGRSCCRFVLAGYKSRNGQDFPFSTPPTPFALSV